MLPKECRKQPFKRRMAGGRGGARIWSCPPGPNNAPDCLLIFWGGNAKLAADPFRPEASP